MITLSLYLMGRDAVNACPAEVLRNSMVTVDRTNRLKMLADLDGLSFSNDFSEVASGWRPDVVNTCISNAAKRSAHLVGCALDTRDADRQFARWCLRNLHQLEKIGLWMEDPRWTPTWVHLQTYPPGSGRRVYVPSYNPPLAMALPEQRA